MSIQYDSSPGDAVKRKYDAPRRRAKAAETRDRVLRAAFGLFLEHGYEAVTANDIAARAGVSRPTVFVAVGGKPEILKEVRDIALVGDDEPVPMPERPMYVELWEEPDAHRAVLLYARNLRAIYERAAGIEVVVQQAASSDPELRDLAAEALRQRRYGCRLVVNSLQEKASLRRGLTTAEAADTAFALGSPETFLHLVRTCGWPPAQYESWLARTLDRELYD